MSKEDILNLVKNAAKELGSENGNNALVNADRITPLYGPGGNLDSLGLVRLITDIEERVSDKFGKDIVIASEKAMSQRNSPFLTVGSLTDFIIELLNY